MAFFLLYRRQFASTFGCSWQALFYLAARLVALPIAFLLVWMFYRDIKVSTDNIRILNREKTDFHTTVTTIGL